MKEKLLSIDEAKTLLIQLSSYLTTQEMRYLYVYDYTKWIKYRDEFIETSINKIIPPLEIREAQRYINQCESDLGFMGSPIYYENKKIVDEYYEKQREANEEYILYQKLKEKYEN
jgi:hypothetical protein